MRITKAHQAWLEGREMKIAGTQSVQEVLDDILNCRGDYGKPGFSTPVENQLSFFQLTAEEINALAREGSSALDIACGSNALLVSWLRKLGVDAEGIDPKIRRESSYLMKKSLTSTWKIPRPDGHYKLVTAHLAPPLADAFTQAPWITAPGQEELITGTLVLLEVLRVTQSDGKFVCWPGLGRSSYLDNILRNERYCIERRRIDLALHSAKEDFAGDLNYLTVIQRN